MSETPRHMAGRDSGCGIMGAIFGTKHRKTAPVPRLEASKDHTSKKPPRTHNRTTQTKIVYTGFSKPPLKNNPQPPKPKPVVKLKPTTYNNISPAKSAFYSVSQVTNISYTKQLRKEPSFTSSELSVRISVRGTPNSNGSIYRASSNRIPGHLGNLMKKTTPDSKLGNIYGNSPKKPDSEVFKNLGNDMYKQGRFDEAIKLYTEAIGINSKIATYYSNRSAALIGLGKLIDAILDCRIAIRINPSYHRAHYRLASLYLRFGETEKALCHYRCSGGKLERHDIGKVQAVKAQLATCCEARKANEWRKVLKETKFAYSLGADSSLEVYAMQTEALLNLHRHDEAYSTFESAPVIDINTASRLFGSTITCNFLTVQAQVYLASGRFEEAVSAALRASELDPSEAVFAVARKTRALAKARANGNKIFKASQFYEACKLYSEGLDHEPYNSLLLSNRAACRYNLGQFERAVEDCSIALNLRPSYAKVRLRRAQCNAKLERWEAAIQDYDVLNHETRGDVAVEREFLEARMQLERQHSANAKLVKLNDIKTEEFKGFFIAA